MFKLLIAAVALISNSCSSIPREAAQTEIELPKPTFNFNYISRVVCEDGTGNKTIGTIFYIGGGQFLTAEHVAGKDDICYDPFSKEPMPVVKADSQHDISLIQMPTIDFVWPGEGMPLSCEGFKEKKIYYTIGFAGGTSFIMNKLVATDEYTKDFEVQGKSRNGMRVLDGLLIQGMSGGPITDINGNVIGINNVTGNMYTNAYSYELKNTFICKGE